MTPDGTGRHQTTRDDTWFRDPCLRAATLGSGARKGVGVRLSPLALPLTCGSSFLTLSSDWPRMPSCSHLLTDARPGHIGPTPGDTGRHRVTQDDTRRLTRGRRRLTRPAQAPILRMRSRTSFGEATARTKAADPARRETLRIRTGLPDIRVDPRQLVPRGIYAVWRQSSYEWGMRRDLVPTSPDGLRAYTPASGAEDGPGRRGMDGRSPLPLRGHVHPRRTPRSHRFVRRPIRP